MTISNEELVVLKQVAEATKQNGVIYQNPAVMTNLVAAALVEGNPNYVDPATPGNIAFRATGAGLTYVQNLEAAAAQPSVAAVAAPTAPVAGQPPVGAPAAPAVAGAPATAFQVGAGFVLPEKVNRRSSPTGRTYPFDQLELGGWIFVPATEKRKDPKKSLASTISGANKRFESFVPRRYFKAVRAAAGQKFGNIVAPSNGAYIVRVEPPHDAPAEGGSNAA